MPVVAEKVTRILGCGKQNWPKLKEPSDFWQMLGGGTTLWCDSYEPGSEGSVPGLKELELQVTDDNRVATCRAVSCGYFRRGNFCRKEG